MDKITITVPMMIRVKTEDAHIQVEGEFTFPIMKALLKDGMREIIEAMKTSTLTVSTEGMKK